MVLYSVVLHAHVRCFYDLLPRFRSISIRVGVSSETVEYDVSQWFGMEEEQMLYKQNMDQVCVSSAVRPSISR